MSVPVSVLFYFSLCVVWFQSCNHIYTSFSRQVMKWFELVISRRLSDGSSDSENTYMTNMGPVGRPRFFLALLLVLAASASNYFVLCDHQPPTNIPGVAGAADDQIGENSEGHSIVAEGDNNALLESNKETSDRQQSSSSVKDEDLFAALLEASGSNGVYRFGFNAGNHFRKEEKGETISHT